MFKKITGAITALVLAGLGVIGLNTAADATADVCKAEWSRPVHHSHQEWRFQNRAVLHGSKEVKDVTGYDFVAGGTTNVSGTSVAGHWVAAAGVHTIPDVIINIVWGSGGVPDSVLGEGTVNLNVYGGPNVNVHYNAHKVITDEGYTAWGPFSDWSTTNPGATTSTRNVETRTVTDPDTTETTSLPIGQTPSGDGWTLTGKTTGDCAIHVTLTFPNPNPPTCQADGSLPSLPTTNADKVTWSFSGNVLTATPKANVVIDGATSKDYTGLLLPKLITQDCFTNPGNHDDTVWNNDGVPTCGATTMTETGTITHHVFTFNPNKPGYDEAVTTEPTSRIVSIPEGQRFSCPVVCETHSTLPTSTNIDTQGWTLKPTNPDVKYVPGGLSLDGTTGHGSAWAVLNLPAGTHLSDLGDLTTAFASTPGVYWGGIILEGGDLTAQLHYDDNGRFWTTQTGIFTAVRAGYYQSWSISGGGADEPGTWTAISDPLVGSIKIYVNEGQKAVVTAQNFMCQTQPFGQAKIPHKPHPVITKDQVCSDTAGVATVSIYKSSPVWNDKTWTWDMGEPVLVKTFEKPDRTCDVTVPEPVQFAADPTPPTCTDDGALPNLEEAIEEGDFTALDVTVGHVTLAFDREFDGPGVYTLTATTDEGYTFEDGTTVKTRDITVDGATGFQTTDPEADCYKTPITPVIHQIDVCGSNNDGWNFNDDENVGLSWTQKNALVTFTVDDPETSVIVPGEGYTLNEDGSATFDLDTWTWNDEPCPTPTVTVTATPTPVVNVVVPPKVMGPPSLAHTGADDTAKIAGLAALLIVAGAGAAALARRRQRA